MKKSLILFLKYLIPIVLFLLLTILTDSIITPLFGIDLSEYNMPDTMVTFYGLFTLAIIQTLIMTLVARRSRLKGKHLGFMLSSLLFGINHVMNIIESLVFLKNIYPVSFQFADLLIGLIKSLILGFTIAALWGTNEDKVESNPEFVWSKKLILSWTGLIIIWFIIYFCAGLLIPMSIEGVSEYYFGNEGAMNMSLVPIGYLMQIPRGSLWILMGILLLKYQRGSWWEKSLITGLVFGGLMSSSLLVPNFIMPDFVRMAHLPEIVYANILWGIILSWKLKKHFHTTIPG